MIKHDCSIISDNGIAVCKYFTSEITLHFFHEGFKHSYQIDLFM